MGAGELPAHQRRVVFTQLFPFNGKSGGELWRYARRKIGKWRNWRLPSGGVFAIIAPCGGQATDGRDDGISGG